MCLGTGIGGSVFIDGKELIPSKNPGMEFGHMIIQKDGNLCNCGKRGCFERYCSIKNLKNELIEKLRLPLEISGEELIKILHTKANENEINNVLNQYVDNLIIGLSNVIDIFEPEVICLGGSFVYFENILYKMLEKEYYERRYVFNKEKMPDLKLAKLGNDAGIIGASIIAWYSDF